jgi:hypothetical protein
MTLKETLQNAAVTAKQVALTANNKVKNITDDLKDYQEKRKIKAEGAMEKLRVSRSASLPIIHKVAEEMGMEVEELDTSAYVSKGTKGIHLPYGLTEGQIRAKLEASLYRSATVSKMVKGAKGVVNTVNQGREALRASGLGKGTMYTDSLAAGNQQSQSLPAGWNTPPGMYNMKIPGQGSSNPTIPGSQSIPSMFKMKMPSNMAPRRSNELPSYLTQSPPFANMKKAPTKKKKSTKKKPKSFDV